MKMRKQRRPRNNKYQYREIIVAYILHAVQIALFWLPVKKNRVMVYVHERKGFACNPKYIVKKLMDLYGDKLEIIWASMYPETCEEVEKLGIRVIKNNRPRQALLYLRTRFFITNDSFPSWAIHRRNQIWMNTWHGAMNYKHIGSDYLPPMSSLAHKIFKFSNRQPDFYLSGSAFFTKDTAKSFRLNEKVFVSSGLPRNDIFFGNQDGIKEKVRKFYDLPNGHLVMYAPTFRKNLESNSYGIDCERICAALHERFGGKWIMLFRNHSFIKYSQSQSGVVDVSGYHDMQELLCVADVLISDYSSCLYDFCLTQKPAFVYATDIENYKNDDRSFAYPIEKWPYPIAQTNGELVNNIRSFDEQLFAQRIKTHLQDTGYYDRGSAAGQTAEIIGKFCQ